MPGTVGRVGSAGGATPGSLNDTVNGTSGLVFTLGGIANASDKDPTVAGECADGSDASLSVNFTRRSILDGGVHGTRSQCVLGLHDYRDKVCFTDPAVLANAYGVTYNPAYSYNNCNLANAPDGIPPVGYIRNPSRNLHITKIPSQEGSGYRWRNGALTVQLLKVSSGNAAEYVLQPASTLPTKKNKRFGGTFAKAFTVSGNAVVDGEGANEGGLLYEATMYWHYSDLADNLRRAAPSSVPCYGDSNYNSALTQELGGLTLGEYNALIGGLGDPGDVNSLIAQYAALLDQLQTLPQDSAAYLQALLDLAELLEANPNLAEYDKYRDYAPGHVPEQHLLDIDKGQADEPGDGGSSGCSNIDGTPCEVIDIQDLDTSTVGPNFEAGRRTWVDLRQ